MSYFCSGFNNNRHLRGAAYERHIHFADCEEKKEIG